MVKTTVLTYREGTEKRKTRKMRVGKMVITRRNRMRGVMTTKTMMIVMTMKGKRRIKKGGEG